MLTPMLRTTLTRQGYKLIGSHSGVKLCRFVYLNLKICKKLNTDGQNQC